MEDRISLLSVRHIMCYVANIPDETSMCLLATHARDTPLVQRVNLQDAARMACVSRRMRKVWRLLQQTELLHATCAIIRGVALRQALSMTTQLPGVANLFRPLLPFERSGKPLAVLERLSAAVDEKFVVPTRPDGYTDVDCMLLSLANMRSQKVPWRMRRTTALMVRLIDAQLGCSVLVAVRVYAVATRSENKQVRAALINSAAPPERGSSQPRRERRNDWRVALALYAKLTGGSVERPILRALAAKWTLSEDDIDDALNDDYRDGELEWLTVAGENATLHRSALTCCMHTKPLHRLAELADAVRRHLGVCSDAHLPIELFEPCMLRCTVPELIATDDSSTLHLKRAVHAVRENLHAVCNHAMLMKLFVHTFDWRTNKLTWLGARGMRARVEDRYGCKLSDYGIFSASDVLLLHLTFEDCCCSDDDTTMLLQWQSNATIAHDVTVLDVDWIARAVPHQRGVNKEVSANSVSVFSSAAHASDGTCGAAIAAIWRTMCPSLSALTWHDHEIYSRRVTQKTGMAVATLALHLPPASSTPQHNHLPLHCVAKHDTDGETRFFITLDSAIMVGPRPTDFLSHLLIESVSGDALWYDNCMRCLSTELRAHWRETAHVRLQERALLSFTVLRAADDRRNTVFAIEWYKLADQSLSWGTQPKMLQDAAIASAEGRMCDSLPLFDTLRTRLTTLLDAAGSRSGELVRMQSFCDACMSALASLEYVVGGCVSAAPQCPGLPTPSAEQAHLSAIRRVVESQCEDSECLASPRSKRRRIVRAQATTTTCK